MITVDIDAASLARVRLTPSPAHEVVAWLTLAAHGGTHPVFGRPGPAARRVLGDPDVALVVRVLAPPGRYVPDLLTPQPPRAPGHGALDAQLAVVAATDAATVAEQVGRLRFGGGPLPAPVAGAVDAGTFAARAAAGLRRFWAEAVADRWPAVRAALDVDLEARAAALAARGVGDVLGALHPSLRWTGHGLEVRKPFDEHRRLRDEELVLAPSALGWPRLTAQLCEPGNAVLTYPAAGFGPLRRAGAPAVMGALLGTTRSEILHDLDVPRSTADVSVRRLLAPATVSYHFGVLLRAGLVTRRRNGHSVLYRRTSAGDALVGGRSAPVPPC